MKSSYLAEGIRLYKKARYSDALELFLHSSPENEEQKLLHFYYIGLCYTHKKMFRDALLYIQQVVESELSFVFTYQCRMILGYIYAVTGNYLQAEQEFRTLTNEGYESAKIYAALAHSAYLQGKVKEGMNLLYTAISLDSENSNALNSLGYILAEENMDLEKAHDFCKRALRRHPNNPAYLDSLALVYFRMGRLEDARATIEKARALSKQPLPQLERRLRLVVKALKELK